MAKNKKPFDDQERYFEMSMQELTDLRDVAIIDEEEAADPYFKKVLGIVIKNIQIYIDARLEIAYQLRDIKDGDGNTKPIKNNLND